MPPRLVSWRWRRELSRFEVLTLRKGASNPARTAGDDRGDGVLVQRMSNRSCTESPSSSSMDDTVSTSSSWCSHSRSPDDDVPASVPLEAAVSLVLGRLFLFFSTSFRKLGWIRCLRRPFRESRRALHGYNSVRTTPRQASPLPADSSLPTWMHVRCAVLYASSSLGEVAPLLSTSQECRHPTVWFARTCPLSRPIESTAPLFTTHARCETSTAVSSSIMKATQPAYPLLLSDL